MADLEFHSLPTAEQQSPSDIVPCQKDAGQGTWITRKFTLNALGLFLNKILEFASDLHTTNKTIIGAINEVHDNSSSPALDDLSDVDIDSNTLAAGQGIFYDATTQKWKNGSASGGSHSYSTTEQVVGTWTDGTPVYEKTIILDNISGTTYATPALNLSIDKVVSFYAYVQLGSEGGSQWITSPFIESSSYRCDCHYQSADDKIYIKSNWGALNAIVVMRYTKSSS